jgi:hypothetical protein
MTQPNKSPFDAVGEFNSQYNKSGQPQSLALPLDYGKALPTPALSATATTTVGVRPQQGPEQKGFFRRAFDFMEKTYNATAQAISFGLLATDDKSPLLRGGFDPAKVKDTWDKSRDISIGRSVIRTVFNKMLPVDEIEKIITKVPGVGDNVDNFIQDHALFVSSDFDIFNKKQAETAFREQPVGRFSSFTTDVVARFVVDPFIVAGKGVKVYKGLKYGIKGTQELRAILAGEKTGRRAERVKGSFQSFIEKTDGMDAKDLFRVQAIRESANPATLADVLADANKIEDVAKRHAVKADIIQFALGDAGAAVRLMEESSEIATKIANLQDEIADARFLGKAIDPKTGQLTLDLMNQGDDLEKATELAKQYKGEIDKLYDDLTDVEKKLSIEGTLNPNMVPSANISSALRIKAAQSQKLIDLRGGAASYPVRILTGFVYKRPKSWIDFNDNQSVQTVDNLLSRVRGISQRQTDTYAAKIATLRNQLDNAKQGSDEAEALSNQIKGLEDDLARATFTVERRNELFNSYISATDPIARANAYQRIEEELFSIVARQFGYSDDDVAVAWRTFSNGRASAVEKIRKSRAYTGATRTLDDGTKVPVGAEVKPVVGGIDGTNYVIPLPLNETQLMKELPTLNIDAMYNALNKNARASRLEVGGKIYKGTAPVRQAGTEILDTLDNVLKFEVLARLGYPIRNVTEGMMRIIQVVGPMAIVGRTAAGARNIVLNRFKGSTLDEIFKWSDTTKLRAYRDELEISLANADDPDEIMKQIDEIDKMIDGKIPMKDKYGLGLQEINGVKYQDALGATPEQQRFIRDRFIYNSAQIVDSHFADASNRMRNAMETNGDWVIVQGSDPGWAEAYQRVVNRQVRGSKITQILLQDKPREVLIREASEFLLRDPEGRKILRNLALGREVEDIVEANMANIEELFPPFADQLRQIAAKRSITAEDVNKFFGRSDLNRPAVNGAQVGTANGTSSVSRAFATVINGFYRFAGEIPEAELVRSPLFIKLYRDRMKASVLNAIETYPGKEIPTAYLRKLENQARQWARSEMRRSLYDTSERVEAAYLLKYIFPFFGAYTDVAQKWSKFVLNDPGTIRRLETIYDSPDRMGLTEERDGITYINIPGSWWKRMGLGDRPRSIPKPSLNLIFQGGSWWNPGAGWFVQFPVSKLIKKYNELERNRIIKEVLPYGADGTGFTDFFIQSAAARRAMALFDEDNPIRRNMTVLVTVEENHKYDMGLRETRPTRNEINDRVIGILKTEVASRLILPFATNTRSPYQFYIDEAQRMREEDPANYRENFYKKYGDDFYLFTTSLSRNNTGIAATIEAGKRSKELADIIQENPEYGWFVVGDANAGEFSPTVYQVQRETAVAPGSPTKQRESRDPYEAVQETNAEKGWITYNKGIDLIESIRIQRGLKSLESKGAEDLKAAKQDFIAQLAAENPDWDTVRGRMDMRKVMNFLKFAQKTVQDPRIANRPDMKTMAEYLKGRQLIIDVLATRESKNIDNESNSDLREAWAEFTGQLLDEDITFSRVYSRILENDKLTESLGK